MLLLTGKYNEFLRYDQRNGRIFSLKGYGLLNMPHFSASRHTRDATFYWQKSLHDMLPASCSLPVDALQSSCRCFTTSLWVIYRKSVDYLQEVCGLFTVKLWGKLFYGLCPVKHKRFIFVGKDTHYFRNGKGKGRIFCPAFHLKHRRVSAVKCIQFWIFSSSSMGSSKFKPSGQNMFGHWRLRRSQRLQPTAWSKTSCS